MIFALAGLALGGLSGFPVGKVWAAVVVLLAPLPLYLGVAPGLWGNGFGENWQYAIPIRIMPVCIGFYAGTLIRRATTVGSPEGQ
jgi:hypothetical protein